MSKPSRNRRRLRAVLLALGPLAVLAAGGYVYLTTGRYVSTENAYVKFDIVVISADVSGRVVEVAVEDNQAVKKGDLLFRVKPETYEINLARAEAEMAAVRNKIESLRASLRQTRQEIREAAENIKFLSREYERQRRLKKRGVASEARYDQARHNVVTARQREKAVRERLNIILAELGGDPEAPLTEHALYLQAKARRDSARNDLRDTVVRAPTDGVVSNVRLQTGEHAEADTAVFSLISSARTWVEANLKETRLTHIRVGQKAEVVVDAYPDLVWKASVESISPATGAEYALLPPQNATGNWVKVVQRVPVRLEIERNPAWPALRSGMTVTVTIDTGRERAILGRASAAFSGDDRKE